MRSSSCLWAVDLQRRTNGCRPMLGGVSCLFSQRVTTDSFSTAAPVSHPDHIEDIPDDDAVVADMQNMNLKANESMPSADDIPDMEEDDLEDAMNSNIVAPVKPAYVFSLPICFECSAGLSTVKPRLETAISRRLANTTR
jgi:hypothetical protein